MNTHFPLGGSFDSNNPSLDTYLDILGNCDNGIKKNCTFSRLSLLSFVKIWQVVFGACCLLCLTVYPQARGEEVPQSFGKYLVEKEEELDLTDNETAYLAGSMFGAGSDTTASAISVALMAATCYAEARKRVQDELDSVVGRGRRKHLHLPVIRWLIILS